MGSEMLIDRFDILKSMLHPIQKALRKEADKTKGEFLARFFKTGPGEYSEGDVFLGIPVPITRSIVKQYKNEITLADIQNMLESKFHEERLAALIALTETKDLTVSKRAKFYLSMTKHINNWDLVDVSADKILGPYIEELKSIAILEKLAQSKNLWEKRIAMITTFYFIKQGDEQVAFRIAELLLTDSHDLIQKAVGWMLREVGKRVNEQTLMKFLHSHIREIKPTSLRYAIERFSPEVREQFLSLRRIK